MSPLTNNNFLSPKSIWYLTAVHQVNWDRSHICHVSYSICFYTWVTIRLCQDHISIAFSDLQLPDLQNKTWISVCFHQLLSHKNSVWDRIAWWKLNRFNCDSRFNIVWMAQGQMGQTSSQTCALANKENSFLHFFGEVTTVHRIILQVKQHPHCGLILIQNYMFIFCSLPDKRFTHILNLFSVHSCCIPTVLIQAGGMFPRKVQESLWNVRLIWRLIP